MRSGLATLRRNLAAVGLSGAIALCGSASGDDASGASTPRDLLALCAAAQASLESPAMRDGAIGETGLAALVAGRDSVAAAYRLCLDSNWTDGLGRIGRRIGASLRRAELKLARLARRADAARPPRVRNTLRIAGDRLRRAVALLQEVAPPAPPPLANADPSPAAPVAAPIDAAFTWTELSPSSDSRTVYVSSSRPDDSGDGLSPATAKKTLAAGYGLLRNGYPDWLLLKKGDSWTEAIVSTDWGKSGRSAAEPLVVTSYGTGARPRIVNGNFYSGHSSNIALVDLSFDVPSADSGQPFRVIGFGNGSNFLVEGCYFARGGVTIQGVSNVRFRGNVVVDAWSGTEGAIGAYIDMTNNLLVEGCVFDHNGWREPNIPRSWFTHNIYIQVDCSNVTVRNNIFARGSGEACMQRPGGLNENNLYLQSPMGLTWGYANWTYEQSHAPGTIRNNVVLDACDLGPSVPRGVGMVIVNSGDVEAYGNIIAHQVNATWGMGITPNGDIKNLRLHDNIVYDWVGKGTYDGATVGLDLQGNWRGSAGTSTFSNNVMNLSRGLLINVGGNSPSAIAFSGNTYHNGGAAGSHFRYWGADKGDADWPAASGETGASFSQPNYVDPARDIGTYMTTLNGTATLEAFLAEARQQCKSNWRPAFTAGAVNDYIRAGFVLKTE